MTPRCVACEAEGGYYRPPLVVLFANGVFGEDGWLCNVHHRRNLRYLEQGRATYGRFFSAVVFRRPT